MAVVTVFIAATKSLAEIVLVFILVHVIAVIAVTRILILLREGGGRCRTSRRPASTPSATAAPRASATAARCRSHLRKRSTRTTSSWLLLGQPQLRGASHPSRGRGKTARLAARSWSRVHGCRSLIDIDLTTRARWGPAATASIFYRADLSATSSRSRETNHKLDFERQKCSSAAYANIFNQAPDSGARSTRPRAILFAFDGPRPSWGRTGVAGTGVRHERLRRRHRRRALPGDPGRQRHDRSHLARRRDPPRQSGWPVPARARHRETRLQLLRFASRQSRIDGRGTFANVRLRNCLSPAGKARGRFISPAAMPCRSSPPLSGIATATRRWWSSPAKSTAPAPPATGLPRARGSSASARSSPRPTSGFTART